MCIIALGNLEMYHFLCLYGLYKKGREKEGWANQLSINPRDMSV